VAQEWGCTHQAEAPQMAALSVELSKRFGNVLQMRLRVHAARERQPHQLQ
jgi:hypothetical protein